MIVPSLPIMIAIAVLLVLALVTPLFCPFFRKIEDEDPASSEAKPLSVILTVHDEAQQLETVIDKFLTQQYNADYQVAVYGGIYRFFNFGEDYTHTYTSFNGGCSLQAYLGRWTLGAYADNGWNFMEGEHCGHQAPAWYITCNYRMNDAFSISLYVQHPLSQHPLTNKTEVISRYVQKEISQHYRDYGNMLTLKLSYRFDRGRKYREIQRTMNHSDKETGILSK